MSFVRQLFCALCGKKTQVSSYKKEFRAIAIQEGEFEIGIQVCLKCGYASPEVGKKVPAPVAESIRWFLSSKACQSLEKVDDQMFDFLNRGAVLARAAQIQMWQGEFMTAARFFRRAAEIGDGYDPTPRKTIEPWLDKSLVCWLLGRQAGKPETSGSIVSRLLSNQATKQDEALDRLAFIDTLRLAGHFDLVEQQVGCFLPIDNPEWQDIAEFLLERAREGDFKTHRFAEGITCRDAKGRSVNCHACGKKSRGGGKCDGCGKVTCLSCSDPVIKGWWCPTCSARHRARFLTGHKFNREGICRICARSRDSVLWFGRPCGDEPIQKDEAASRPARLEK